MKRTIVVVTLLWASVCTMVILSPRRGPRAPAGVALSLVGYTTNANYTGTWRKATFVLTNGTSRHCFFGCRRHVQVVTQQGWADDPSYDYHFSGDVTGPKFVVNPGQAEEVQFHVPMGTNRWRCSVLVIDCSDPPKWERFIRDVIGRVGIKVKPRPEPRYIIWSPEKAR